MTERTTPIIVEQIFSQPPKELWRAVTELEQMTKWYFQNIPAFEPKVGFETEFEVQSDQRKFQHLWKVVEAKPLRLITYSWNFRGIEGQGMVTFELIPKDGGTLLRLTNTGLDSFPSDIPEFTRESCEGGWDYFIRQNLVAYMKDK